MMKNLVEVTLALEPTDAAKLVDLAGGADNVNDYAAKVIQNLHTEKHSSGLETADADAEQFLANAQSLIDMYG